MRRFNVKILLQTAIHVLAWGLFLSLLTSLVPKPHEMNPLLSILIPDLFFISFFYLNFYCLVPHFFVPKKYLLFGLICSAWLVLTITVPSSFSGSDYGRPGFRELPAMKGPEHMPPPPPGITAQGSPEHGDPGRPDEKPPFRIRFFIPEFSYTIFVFLFILTLSTGIRILIEWQQTEKEKVKAELAFLKAQINPHFLFNTLNSIYSLAVIKDEKTADAIGLFSDLMRYVLYESSHDYIPLEKKLQYIDTYIELQKMRLPSNVRVEYTKKGVAASLSIAPLTLMPFIENAFKYGVSTEKDSFISIAIEINGSDLSLLVRNSRPVSVIPDPGASKLGVVNTVKRLGLLYPGRYELKTGETSGEYTVYLQISLR